MGGAAAAVLGCADQEDIMRNRRSEVSTLHSARSGKSVAEVSALLPGVVSKHQFGTLNVTDLRQKMKEKGVEFDRECRVFDVCNPKQAKTVLSGDMAVSTVLPCRISVYEEGGQTVLATLKPTSLLGLFGHEDLLPVAKQVEATLIAIVEEAASA